MVTPLDEKTIKQDLKIYNLSNIKITQKFKRKLANITSLYRDKLTQAKKHRICNPHFHENMNLYVVVTDKF